MTWQKITLVSLLATVVGIIVLEALGLLFMYLSVGRFKEHWEKRIQQPGEFVYVALGDSAAQGVGATSAERSYVGIIAKRISQKTGKTVRIVNISQSGAKIQDAIQNQVPQVQRYKPDLVTVEIGANDIASFNDAKFKADFTKLSKLLPANTYASNMPYFGSRSAQRPHAFEASKIIEQTLSKDTRLKLVDLQSITLQRESKLNYAPDYFHPNNRAYNNWADAFWKEIEGML